jgi:transcription elongation factor
VVVVAVAVAVAVVVAAAAALRTSCSLSGGRSPGGGAGSLGCAMNGMTGKAGARLMLLYTVSSSAELSGPPWGIIAEACGRLQRSAAGGGGETTGNVGNSSLGEKKLLCRLVAEAYWICCVLVSSVCASVCVSMPDGLWLWL